MPSFRGRIKDRQIILWVHVAKPNLDSDSVGSEAIAFEALVDTVLLDMDLLENFHLTIHKDLFILSN